MNRDLLSRRLRQLGHAVELAVNGRQALEKIAAEEFDLVLLDIMMPEVDGYKVLETLRGNGALDRLPVIMISAVTEIDSVVRCVEMGATDYLPKPFNPVLLKARVGATLEKKRLRDKERLWAKSMERELEIGREIQASFLPEELPQPSGWEIAARFFPARQVAGDFYDAFILAGGTQIGLVVADVCDKGVGAALFMALFRSLLRAGAERAFDSSVVPSPEGASSVIPSSEGARDPGAARLLSTVVSTNDYIARTHGNANMFATVFFAVLDPADGSFSWINAGHEAPIVCGASGVTARLAPRSRAGPPRLHRRSDGGEGCLGTPLFGGAAARAACGGRACRRGSPRSDRAGGLQTFRWRRAVRRHHDARRAARGRLRRRIGFRPMWLLLRILVNAAALWVATEIVPGVEHTGPWTSLLLVALVFGLLNAFVRPILKLLTCPLILLTLGLFTFVINAIVLWLTSAISGSLGLGFHVSGFWAAFLGALVVTVVSVLLSVVLRDAE
jgi:phosphoserine phosphatase RsbU/P